MVGIFSNTSLLDAALIALFLLHICSTVAGLVRVCLCVLQEGRGVPCMCVKVSLAPFL